MQYLALLEYEEEAKGYSVLFPDCKGCYSAGDTYEEAIRNAREALSLWADGQSQLPKARSLEEIKNEWEHWAEWEQNYRFIIAPIALLPLNSKAKRYSVTLDEALVARIDAVANNRSAFLEAAARQALGA
jgi:predicted RNase H-like HicB family nuclease